MKEINPQFPDEQDQAAAAEQAWLTDHLPSFWQIAQSGYHEAGPGAIVIDAYSEPLSDDARFHYADLAQFIDQPDEVSQRLAQILTEYDPAQELVAVIISQPDEEYTFGTYRVQVSEDLSGVQYEPKPTPIEIAPTETLEPPDIETLIAWEAEGGCEAACPHGCWVEPDGVCPHGNSSWLLVMGFI